MDLRTLRYVTTAVRMESITKAAARLHVAQSALSRTIKLLEEELGVVLLLRHPHGIKATKDGLRFVESAETLLRLAQQLRDEARSYASEPVGQIRFGFLPSQGELFIGPLIAAFVRKYPKVNFVLREALSGELAELLLADKLDLAVMLYDTKHQDLHRQPLFMEEIWLVAARSVWALGSKPLVPRQLEGLPLVHAGLVGQALRRLATRHKAQLHTLVEGDISRVARSVVRDGGAYLLMPHSFIEEDIARGVVAGAPIKGLEVRRSVSWRADRPQSRAVVAFVEEIEKAVAALKASKPRVIREFPASK